jgi:hypothetical protein
MVELTSVGRNRLLVRKKIYVAVCAALLIPPIVAHPAASQEPDGDQVLARAVSAPGLRSYSVPVHFAVQLTKPLPLETQVDAVAYYAAPAQSALVITNASGLAGAFFRGGYKIDVVPQSWPAAYHVASVVPGTLGGNAVLLLHAQRRTDPGDLSEAVITVTKTNPPVAVAAEWRYTDGSSIRFRFQNERTATYTLPGHASINVDKPGYGLNADAAYGDYAFNVPISPEVFASAH